MGSHICKPDWRKRSLAYNAMERDSLSGEPELVAKADDAMVKLRQRTLDAETFWHYVYREQEWRTLNY